MINSISAEKSLDKSQHPFMIFKKKSNKEQKETSYSETGYIPKSTANNLFDGETLRRNSFKVIQHVRKTLPMQ